MWGTQWRQRLRLAPLFLSIVAADKLAPLTRRRGVRRLPPRWRNGISVVIPERDSPDLLQRALASACASLAGIDEPQQIVVVVNGAARETYTSIAARFPHVEWVHHRQPLGFSAAIRLGVARARHDWTLLLNNDVTLDAQALRELIRCRDDDVFAVGAQIVQQSADGRREETGFTDWYVDAGGIRVFHADPGANGDVRPHLCASGGAGIFRTARLRRYVRGSRCYDPFYWEDVEWGVRAWQDGLRVLFCPQALAWHRHRSTTARFYAASELDRVVERNRMLFDARNAVTDQGAAWLLDRVCDLPYRSQRELSRLRVAAAVFRQRFRARRLRRPSPPPRLAASDRQTTEIAPASYSYRFRADRRVAAAPRPRLLLVTPFSVFPPRHGGARRIAGLLRVLRHHVDVVLVSDEASLYDARSFAHFDALYAVHLVQRRETASSPHGGSLPERMRTHMHESIVRGVEEAVRRYAPHLVQIEHVELAGLVRCKLPGQRWILGLHDACGDEDFADPADARRFQDEILEHYDAVTVCSPEDRSLIAHQNVVCVPNGSSVSLETYHPSHSMQILFMGPFRYGPNLDGIREFLRVAYPAITAAVPGVRLLVLGGDGAKAAVAGDARFAQRGVDVLDHRDDVAPLLAESALTINPLSGIRGSAVKLIESLSSGRVCVSTREGARGFLDSDLPGLVTVATIDQMSDPIIALLQDPAERRLLELPQPSRLERFQWETSAAIQHALYRQLLGSA